MGYRIHATRGEELPLVEDVERQGTAWRRARHLFAAGYAITVFQYSVEDPPQPLAVYQFDGIRWKSVEKFRKPA